MYGFHYRIRSNRIGLVRVQRSRKDVDSVRTWNDLVDGRHLANVRERAAAETIVPSNVIRPFNLQIEAIFVEIGVVRLLRQPITVVEGRLVGPCPIIILVLPASQPHVLRDYGLQRHQRSLPHRSQ